MQNTIFTTQIVKFIFYFIIAKRRLEANPAFFSSPVRGDGSGLLYITDQWGFQVKVTIDKQDAPWMCSCGIAYAVMNEE